MGRTPANPTHCKECGAELNEFNIVRKLRYTSSKCRDCWNKYQKKYNDRVTPELKRVRHLKYAYGLTVEDYEVLMKIQDGRCAICGNEDAKNLCVDHNHETGQIRGLLCKDCNVVIGIVNESLDRLEEIRNYLMKYMDLPNIPEIRHGSD